MSSSEILYCTTSFFCQELVKRIHFDSQWQNDRLSLMFYSTGMLWWWFNRSTYRQDLILLVRLFTRASVAEKQRWREVDGNKGNELGVEKGWTPEPVVTITNDSYATLLVWRQVGQTRLSMHFVRPSFDYSLSNPVDLMETTRTSQAVGRQV
jgi:hypothetical protein